MHISGEQWIKILYLTFEAVIHNSKDQVSDKVDPHQHIENEK